MRQHLEPCLQPTRRLRFLERGDEVGVRAVVDATAALCGGNRQADRQMRLAHTRRAEEGDVFRRSTKPSSCKFSICSRRSDGWKEKSNSVSRLIAGAGWSASRLEAAVVAHLDLRAEELLDSAIL
jgi:hypothetical protein